MKKTLLIILFLLIIATAVWDGTHKHSVGKRRTTNITVDPNCSATIVNATLDSLVIDTDWNYLDVDINHSQIKNIDK